MANVQSLAEVRAVREPGKRMRSRLLDAAVELFKAKGLAGVAALRDKAREEQVLVRFGRIDGGDPEAETDAGIGGGAPALAENPLLPGPGHDVVHGEEVVWEVEPLEELRLALERCSDLVRNPIRKAPGPGRRSP